MHTSPAPHSAVSLHASHVPELHTWPLQSALVVHARQKPPTHDWPMGHTVVPLQAPQTPPVQMGILQSDTEPQWSPLPHFGQLAPPQSTSVSVPSFTLLAQGSFASSNAGPSELASFVRPETFFVQGSGAAQREAGRDDHQTEPKRRSHGMNRTA